MSHPRKRRSTEEWYELIKECLASDKSVNAWCKENNIGVKAYYSHLKKLRAQGYDMPEKTKPVKTGKAHVSEIVPVEFSVQEVMGSDSTPSGILPPVETTAIRLCMKGIVLEITNNADAELLRNTISALQTLC